ncbi:hypothetical protein OG320_10700 [Microbispora sp. NBC_01189]|uniref:hypothetical protein n=1 Tax=Microbispora sp. NBC_01189 TaxID=2903583 RepID=UPI002E0D989A|nr:hypothetical protein OG320_10700 [Microbispora sp. NBC_01189]
MTADLAALVSQMWPYAAEALTAYGGAVLAKAQEDAADAAVGWGRKMLQRVFGVKTAEESPDVIAELVEDPEDADLQAALRARMRKLLAGDPQMAADVARLVEQAGQQVAVGQGQVIAQASDHAQQANLGQGTMNVSFGVRHDR